MAQEMQDRFPKNATVLVHRAFKIISSCVSDVLISAGSRQIRQLFPNPLKAFGKKPLFAVDKFTFNSHVAFQFPCPITAKPLKIVHSQVSYFVQN